MLSILPDLSDSDLSSDSSEASEHLRSGIDETKRGKECKQKYAGTRGKGPLLPYVSPRLQTELTSTSAVKQRDHGAAAVEDAGAVNSSTLQSESIIKKFAELQEKRLQAVEEKIAEGYRRRRRKRKFQELGPPQDAADSTGADQRPSDSHHNHTRTTDNLPCEGSSEGPSKKQQEQWDTLKGYLNVNSHISQGVDHGHFAPNKSGLEKRLDEAVAEGDFDKAEKLSEELSVRELGCKIAKAADARDYMKWKAERDEEKAAKKRKKKNKLAWGFEVKNRWEMKANM